MSASSPRPQPPSSPDSTDLAPSRGLYRSGFTTEGLTKEERLWAYTAASNAMLATTPLTDQLDVTLDMYALGGAVLTHARASARRTERTPAMISAGGYDEVSLHLTLRGEASGDAEGHPVTTGPGDMIVLDMTRPFSITDAGPREGIGVIYPRASLMAVCPDPGELHGLVLGPERNGLLGDHLRALLPRLPTLPNTAGPALARTILELFAVVLERPLLEKPPEVVAAAHTLDRERIAVLSYIDAHLSDPDLGPSSVATALGLSRSRLYQMFAMVGGVSQHLWRRRLAAVHQALLNPEERRTISELAFTWGFASPAHFNRAFRIAYGDSPGQIRRKALGRE